KAKNAALDAEIAAVADELVVHEAVIVETDENVEAGEAILKAPCFNLAITRPDLFEVDRQYVPFRTKWIGGEIGTGDTDVKATLAALKAELAARAGLERTLAAAESNAAYSRTALATAKADIATLQADKPKESEADIGARVAAAESKMVEARDAHTKVTSDLGTQRGLLSSLRSSAITHAEQVTRLTA